jgi:integrase
MVIERVKIGGRGQGSLIRYSNSPHWHACFYSHGKEHRESTQTPDLKKARAFLKAKLDEVSADRSGLRAFVPAVARRVTIGGLLDDLEQDVKLRELKSAYKLGSFIRAVRAYFGTWKASDVDAAAIDRRIEALRAAGKKNATINRQLQVLGAALKLGHERKKLRELPSIRKLSEKDNARQGFFEAAEVETVIAALPDYLRDLVRFAYLTGWRKGEVVSLRWEWVDLAGGTVTLPTTKNGLPRKLTFGGELVDLFKRRESARLVERKNGPVVSDFVFHRRGRTVGDFKKTWAKALTAAGLTHQEKAADGTVRVVHDRLFHDLRRTAARNMLRVGVREGVAMTVTGHKTRSMFDRYAITSGDDVRVAMERVSV